jgi:hypothetical protein
VTYEWTEYRQRGKPGRDGRVPDRLDRRQRRSGQLLRHCCPAPPVGVSNYASWCNEDFEAAIQDAKTTADQAERTALYTKAQEIFKARRRHHDAWRPKVFMPMNKKVIGLHHGSARHSPLRQRRRRRIIDLNEGRAGHGPALFKGKACSASSSQQARADRADLPRHHDHRLRFMRLLPGDPILPWRASAASRPSAMPI